tara:strand:- start:222 stop:389 length:168 start_codon:yes stop_codon:yes gene_type:complete
MNTPEGLRLVAIKGLIVVKPAPGSTTGSPVKMLLEGVPARPVDDQAMISVTASLL